MLRPLALLGRALWLTTRERRRRGPRRPTWSFTFEWIVNVMRLDWLKLENWPAERVRREWDSRLLPERAQRKVRRVDDTLAGCRARWFFADGVSPELARERGQIGSLRTHGEIMAEVALASGLAVVGIEYRLAPEHPYPAALDDTLAVIAELARRGHPPSRLALVGDSAGGNLALSTQLALRDRGQPQAALAVLISPWLDFAGRFPSVKTAQDDYGTPEMLLRQARDFAGGLLLDDPRLSPIEAPPAGLAPVVILVGTAERLLDECVEYARRGQAARVDVHLELLRDLPHNGPLFAAFSDEARRALERIGHHLREGLAPPAARPVNPPAIDDETRRSATRFPS